MKECPLTKQPTKIYCEKPPATYYVSKQIGLIFQGEPPSVEKMQSYAEKEYSTGVYQKYVDAAPLKKEMFRKRISPIQQRIKGGRLLDVGCSSGFFLETALESGFDAFGIEFSKEAIAQAKPEIQKRITCADVNEWVREKKQTFDVIVAFDLIEHTQDPLLFLQNLKKMLSPNGWIVISTPDIGHFLRYLMRSHWPMLQPLQHTYLFSKKAMLKAFEMTGLENIHIQNATKTLSLDYLMGQIQQNNPLLSKLYRLLSRLLPKKLMLKPFSVNIGEMLAFAQNTPTKGDNESK